MRIVIDLDGTLCRGNTFRLWTVAAFLKPNRVNLRSYLASATVFVLLYALRMMRAINHWQMKRLFVTFWGINQHRNGALNKARQFNQHFADSICKRKLNGSVINAIRVLELELPTSKLALATAAPAFYASHIARWLGADCLASTIEDEELAKAPFHTWSENVKEAKRDRVTEWLDGEKYIVFTDHEDDWPLISGAEQVFLVAPSRRLIARMAELTTAWVVVK